MNMFRKFLLAVVMAVFAISDRTWCEKYELVFLKNKEANVTFIQLEDGQGRPINQFKLSGNYDERYPVLLYFQFENGKFVINKEETENAQEELGWDYFAFINSPAFFPKNQFFIDECETFVNGNSVNLKIEMYDAEQSCCGKCCCCLCTCSKPIFKAFGLGWLCCCFEIAKKTQEQKENDLFANPPAQPNYLWLDLGPDGFGMQDPPTMKNQQISMQEQLLQNQGQQ